MEGGLVAVRARGEDLGQMPLDAFIQQLDAAMA
jgi:threonyl-tRNA synthetase